jgi:hypothetical protein
MSTTTIAIICAVLAALALALGWKISRQDRPSDDEGDWIEYDEYDDAPEPDPPAPLYKAGDRVLLRYNWWRHKGFVDDRPEGMQWDDGYSREVCEERRAEVLAQVAFNPWSNDSLYLVFADGNLTVPLSACDGSNRITYYQRPDPTWLIRSKWGRDWL